ncbi:MAG: aminotransferase class III-fold pyridoxal phosphate-dependent enzyme [Candidatus Marinimicrobia bacterium]|nr:aminotransferase class III-fold pyridoxal phosphate-dependent enzyme [Candidatus Neomarinimicrobiota bacterium]
MMKPDIIAIAKGIGGGFPVGACLATSRVAAVLSAGSHGTTYGGNPLAMAVGNAVIDEILSPGFLDNINRVSGMLMEGLQALKRKHEDIILDIRGKGLIIGMECSLPIRPLQINLIETGMIAAAAGPKILRLFPPLNIKDEEITEALEKLDQVFKHAHSAKAPAAS